MRDNHEWMLVVTVHNNIAPSCVMTESESADLHADSGAFGRIAVLLAKAYISSQSAEDLLAGTGLDTAAAHGIGNTERRIIEALEKNGPMAPFAISKCLELSRSTLARALTNLLNMNRIEAQGKTRRRIYEAIATPLAARAA